MAQEGSDVPRDALTVLDDRLGDLEREPTLAAVDRFSAAISAFAIEPYLLDEDLNQLVHRLFLPWSKSLLTRNPTLEVWSTALYLVFQIRGRKTVISYFPAAVHDLPLLLELFSDAEAHTHSWQTNYILLSWLGLVCSLPFDLTTLQTPQLEQAALKETLFRLGLQFSAHSSKDREAAGFLLVALAIRPDCQDLFERMLRMLSEDLDGDQWHQKGFQMLTMIECVARLTKTLPGKQLETMRDQAYHLLALVDASSSSSNALVRLQRQKLTGHLALALPSGSDQLNNLISHLFEGVSDQNYNVRLAAGKYIARVGASLPPEAQSQIIEGLWGPLDAESTWVAEDELDMTSISETNWHGSIVALAECARLNLSSVSTWSSVYRWLESALQVDVKRTSQIIGGSIRDAACYAFWCIIRSSICDVLFPFSDRFAAVLVAVALFDREVHVRRAASAVFQEAVGRMGTLQDGISVLQNLNFLTVTSTRKAFLEVCPALAPYKHYRTAILAHLSSKAIYHWDSTIRQYAAEAFKQIELTEQEITILADSFLSSTTNESQIRAHGSWLGLGAIGSRLSLPVKAKVMAALPGTPPAPVYSESKLLVYMAACSTIESCATEEALASNRISSLKIIETVLDANLDSSAPAVAALQRVVLLVDGANFLKRLTKKIATSSLRSPSVGSVAALVAYDFQSPLYASYAESVTSQLSAIVSDPLKDARLRRQSLLSWGSIVRAAVGPAPVNYMQALGTGLTDFTRDQRGDVGRSMRLISVLESEKILRGSYHFKPDDVLQIIKKMALLLADRIDNVRMAASESLRRLSHDAVADATPAIRQLLSSVERYTIESIPMAASVFQTAVKLVPDTLVGPAIFSRVVLAVGRLPAVETEAFKSSVQSSPEVRFMILKRSHALLEKHRLVNETIHLLAQLFLAATDSDDQLSDLDEQSRLVMDIIETLDHTNQRRLEACQQCLSAIQRCSWLNSQTRDRGASLLQE